MSARSRPMTRFLPRPPRPAPPGADLLRRAFALAYARSVRACHSHVQLASRRLAPSRVHSPQPHGPSPRRAHSHPHTNKRLRRSRACGLCHGGLSRRSASTAFYHDPPRARSLSHDRPNSSRTVLAAPSPLDTPIVTAAHRFALRLLAQDGKWARRKTTAIRLASLRRASPRRSHGATEPTRSWLT